MRSSLLVVGLLVACGGAQEATKSPETTSVAVTPSPAAVTPAAPESHTSPAAPKPTMAEMQKTTTATIFEAWNTHDAKKLASAYAENATMHLVGMPAVTGRDAIEKSMSTFFGALSDLKTAPRYQFMKDEAVITIMDVNAKHSSDFWGVKASNKPIGWTGAVVSWFDADGHIKEEHVYWDANTVMAQLGASKQKGRAIPTIAAKSETFTSTASETETKNMNAAKNFYASFEKKNDTDFVGMMTEATEWDDMTQPDTFKGTKVAKKYFADSAKAFPDQKTEVKHMWAFGDFVVAEYGFTGTNKAPFMGMKATNKPVNFEMIDVMMMKDGKVTKGWGFSNGMQVAEQMGLMAAPSTAPAAKTTTPAAKPATPATPAKPATPAAPKK